MRLIAFICSIAAAACGASATVHPVRLEVRGTAFATPDGTPFPWRGITAFRLAEMVAAGNDDEAAAYLDWAAANGVTVVRVLAMAQNLFQLSPEDGRRALPRLLEMAAGRGLQVEVVALADTAHFEVDLDEQVRAIGEIAGKHPNAIVEIANEPFHRTQHPSLHESSTLIRLAKAVPEEVLVAYGEYSDAAPVADYLTVHTPRGGEPWDHVLSLAEGHGLVERHRRPVVSDEPIGAAPQLRPGRRDNSPERFRAAAILTRMAGMHATFHYEGGLHAKIPTGIELACFRAWLDGWRQLPATFTPERFERVESGRGHAFEAASSDGTYVLTIRNGTAQLARKSARQGFTKLQ